MTHYAENPGSVRAEFFRPENGKWYMTEAIDMSPYYSERDIFEAVRKAILDKRNDPTIFDRYIIVVLDPYHQNSYPIMLKPRKT